MDMLCKITALGDSIHDMHSLAVAHPNLEAAVLHCLGQYTCEITLLARRALVSFWDKQGRVVLLDIVEPGIVRFSNDIPTFPALWALARASTTSIRIGIPNPVLGYNHQDMITLADNIFLIYTSDHFLEDIQVRPQRVSAVINYREIDPVVRFVLFNLMKNTSIPDVGADGFDNLGMWGGFPKRSIQIETKRGVPLY